MPPRSSKVSRDDGAFTADDSSSSSDVDAFVVVFANRTPAELKAGKPIHYSNKLKKIIINHAIEYAYSAKSPPSLPVFLELFLDKLGGRAVTSLGSKSIAKSCIRSVAGELTTLLCASGTAGLIQEQKVDGDEYRVLVSKALIKVVKDDELEMNMFKSGHLEDLHANGGRKMKAMVAASDALPTSTTALVRTVVDHLIRTGQIQRQASGNRFTGQIGSGTANVQAPIAAHYGRDSITATEADARALKKNHDAQIHAYKNFAKFVHGELRDAKERGEPGSLPRQVKKSWEWNGSKIDFDKKKDYVAWQQSFFEKIVDRNLSSGDDEAESETFGHESDDEAVASGEDED